VDIQVFVYDETNTRIVPEVLAARIKSAGAGLVCLTGVQSNQFPRALDLARRFRAAQAEVAIGGFHVSGCVAMLPELTPELREAQALGCGLYAGEVEGRFDELLQDAFSGRPKPLYNFLHDLPALVGAPFPLLPA
jgi:hypothetical protein